MDDDVVQAAVLVYNHTPHTAFNNEFTPYEVQSNPELEDCFIRENFYKLQEAKRLQQEEGLFRYKIGNVILIHLSETKTKLKFKKRRRNFDQLAVFIDYEFGNVLCYLLFVRKNGNDIADKASDGEAVYIRVPIYYTKYVAEDEDHIPTAYLKAFST
jgi:hypothetical protein